MIASLACILLAVMGVHDLRKFRIRNHAIGALIALFFANFLWFGEPSSSSLAGRLMFAGAILAITGGAFAKGAIGAGDAKLMTAVALWVGPGNALVFAAGLFFFTLVSCLAIHVGLMPVLRNGRSTRFPFGPSISAAGILVIAPQMCL